MHYVFRTSMGLNMQLSLELLTLEMGISSQPLQESYKRYGPWITAGSLGGIIRSAPKAILQVDKGFYGAGCPHLWVESLVEQLNKLLMHYKCRTSVGLKMQLSLELRTLEMGILSQPLQES